jgi:glycosyltransferase involved in cell wall biosynthesis
MSDGRRVAIVHYWLVKMRGGERVLERLLRLFPNADLFTHVYDPAAMSEVIRSRRVRTTFIQKLPGARRYYRQYLPLMPLALEELDLTGYDLVICSESGPAKGVITAPEAQQVCYCHSPMRYLWDHYPAYRAAAGPIARLAMPWSFHKLRQWDTVSAARVDQFIANSTFVQRRIAKAYRRDSTVIHPPVDTSLFHVSTTIDARWLWVGQMNAYKRPDLAVEAFNAMGLPLLMVGDGDMAKDMRRRAGPNITIVPRLNFDELRRAYAQCRALVFTADEDFGIVPVEAMASGRPVLAYGKGGAVDTVEPGKSGLFFQEQTVESLIDGIERMEAWLDDFDPTAALTCARRFSPERFDDNFLAALGLTAKSAERAPRMLIS